MNVIDENKLQAAGDEVVDRSKAAGSALLVELAHACDGWTATINIPAFYIWKLRIAIPDITIRLNKPQGVTSK